ncbi:MAG: ribonuclease III [Myxococcota bacterium]
MSHDLDALEERLGYRFRDRKLLETALRHASYAHEHPGLASNERLEFLGDAVIGVSVAHLLFVAHPDWAEGDLTRALHKLVDQQALAGLGRELQLGEVLCLGRTEERSAGESKSSILADGVEAVLGAIYLDGGVEPVIQLARRVFALAFANDAPRVAPDPKTGFQERVMARFGEFPSYELVRDSAVDGDASRFTVRVMVRGECWATGTGRSKRAAERAAAVSALPRVEPCDAPHE